MEEHISYLHHCPRCHIGEIKLGHRPYVKLFRGYVFTVANANVYECDICGYYEFEESLIEVVNQMMFRSTAHDDARSRTYHHLKPALSTDSELEPRSSTKSPHSN